MECEITGNAAFKPFELKIKVESKEELEALWHRFNTWIPQEYKSVQKLRPVNTEIEYSCSKKIWVMLEAVVQQST